jgi:hypothetical protein
MKDCSVGIVTYNSEKTIERTLQALAEHWPEHLSGEVVVVDNGSSDLSCALFSQAVERASQQTGQFNGATHLSFRLIHSPIGNCGYGAGQNQAFAAVESRIHLIMNPDIAIKNPQSVQALVDCLDQDPSIGLAMPCIVDPDGQVQYLARRDLTVLDLLLRYLPGRWFARRQAQHAMQDHDYSQPFDIEFASGCLMAIRSCDFAALGGFDPRYFLYAEDADLSRKVREQGLRVRYEPASVVEHSWSRGSYRSLGLLGRHLQSIWRYFRKWGFRWL